MGPGSYIRCPMSDKRERASIASPITQANGVRTLPHRGTHPARMGRNSIARGAAPGGKMPLRIVCFLPQAPSGRHTGREQWHRRRTDFTSSPSGQCRDTACRPGGASGASISDGGMTVPPGAAPLAIAFRPERAGRVLRSSRVPAYRASEFGYRTSEIGPGTSVLGPGSRSPNPGPKIPGLRSQVPSTTRTDSLPNS